MKLAYATNIHGDNSYLLMAAEWERDTLPDFPSAERAETSRAALEAVDAAALPQRRGGNEAPPYSDPDGGASSELRNTIVAIALAPRTYGDYAREKRVYESGGFGGAYSAPSGSLES